MTRKLMQCAWLMATMSIVVFAHAQAPAAPGARPPPPVQPAVPRARGPSLTQAIEAAQSAVAACAVDHYKITVLVVDSAGVPVLMFSADGAAERGQGIAATKAAAAIRFNMSSAEAGDRAKVDAALAEQIKADPKIGVARGGAVLLKAGSETVGAIAVSGAPGADRDVICAQAGADKMKNRLR